MAWRKPTNLREWLRVFFRHRKKFFFAGMTAMIVVVVASKYVPRAYRAEATFQRSNEGMTDMRQIARNQILDPIRRAVDQDIRGRPAVEQLVEDLQLTRNLPHNPDGTLTPQGQLMKSDLVKQIRSKLHVYFSIRSDQLDRITVSYTDSDRVLAPKIVNRAVSNYIDSTRAAVNDRLVTAKTFFEREVARFSAKVSELEAKKLRFELNNPGLRPDDPSSLKARLVELRARLERVEQDLQVNAAKRDSLEEFIKTMPEFIEKEVLGVNPERAQLQLQISALERDLDEHLHRWGRTDAHPLVKKTRAMIVELQKKMATVEAEVQTGKERTPNTQRATAIQELNSLNSTVVALEGQRDELRNQIEQLEVQDRNFFVTRNEYQRIMRELNEAQSQLQFWDTNLRNTSLTLQQEVAAHGIRMAIHARADDLARPSSPTFIGILAAAIAAGLAAGVAMIILSELLDHSFQSVEQAVDELKLPVLGTVNEIVSPGEAFRRKVFRVGVYPGVAAALVLVLLGTFYLTWLSLESPQSYEQLRKQPAHYLKEMLLG